MQKQIIKYHAYMQGDNATVYWDTLLEALIWRAWYNLKHWCKRDGKKITNIMVTSYVYKSNILKRQKPEYNHKIQKNRNNTRIEIR